MSPLINNDPDYHFLIDFFLGVSPMVLFCEKTTNMEQVSRSQPMN